jgi:hypothetical protein
LGCSISVKGIPLFDSYALDPVHPEADLSAANKIKFPEVGIASNMHFGSDRGNSSIKLHRRHTQK